MLALHLILKKLDHFARLSILPSYLNTGIVFHVTILKRAMHCSLDNQGKAIFAGCLSVHLVAILEERVDLDRCVTDNCVFQCNFLASSMKDNKEDPPPPQTF